MTPKPKKIDYLKPITRGDVEASDSINWTIIEKTHEIVAKLGELTEAVNYLLEREKE